MDSEPQGKRLKIEEIDRISDMPDSILAKILSKLPIKSAVGTRILSTRWKNLFPFCVPIKLDLNDSLLLNPSEINTSSTSFVDFVDRLLNITLSDVSIVESMALSCDKNYGDAKIASWIRAAILLDVQELILTFNYHLYNDSKILFDTLNGCTTLSTLVLRRHIRWRVPRNFRLPNLKTLNLRKVIFDDKDNLTKSNNLLVDACPALESLKLRRCNLQNLKHFYIQSPLIRKLDIRWCLWTSISELVIDCPNLESFSCTDCVAKGNYPSKFKSPLRVSLDVFTSKEQVDLLQNDHDGPWYDGVRKLVDACSRTIELRLSHRSLYAMGRSSVPLPVFQNLSSLWLGSEKLSSLRRRNLGVSGWVSLARLLSNAPNLVQITIKEIFEGNIGGYANFQNSLPKPPVCLELRMKLIEFWLFKGDKDEIKLMKYFLKNGQVLQKLILHCAPSVDKEIQMKLLQLPRHLRSCQIAFEQTIE